MATDLIERTGSDPYFVSESDVTELSGNTYECRILICPERDGGYSVFAMRLPGVASQGESVDEAIANIEEAFRETVRSYFDDTGEVPWGDADIERVNGSLERWILVNV